MGIRSEFRGPKRMGGWTQFIPAIASVASGLLGRKDAKDAQKQASKPIPTSQQIKETTTHTAPEWLTSFLQDNLFPRLDGVGELYEKLDPSIAQAQQSPYMDQAAQSLMQWMNSPMFGNTMQMGQGALGQLLSGQNPMLAFAQQNAPMMQQALMGMMNLGNNDPLAYGSQVQNNLQMMIDKAFGGQGGGMGGMQPRQQGSGRDYYPDWRPNNYDSNRNSMANPGGQLSSSANLPSHNRQYLDMIASGRNDHLTPWGYGGAPPTNLPDPKKAGGSILHALLGVR